jgi:hypothetical protein
MPLLECDQQVGCLRMPSRVVQQGLAAAVAAALMSMLGEVAFPSFVMRQGYWCAVDETVTRGGVHPSQGRVKHHDPSLYGLYTNHIV